MASVCLQEEPADSLSDSSHSSSIIKGTLSPQGREGMQLVVIKNYMNIFIFHK